jgi:hypothetical protein
MTTAAPRVLLDLSPVLLATALGRVLSGRGYMVDIGGPDDGHDLAVVSSPSGEREATVQIQLPPLEGPATTARVIREGAERSVPVRDLQDLLALIDRELDGEIDG